MNNAFDQMRDALATAKDVQQAADSNAERMAKMLVGRLRHVDRYTLVQLKRELNRFDAQQKKWKPL